LTTAELHNISSNIGIGLWQNAKNKFSLTTAELYNISSNIGIGLWQNAKN
jgi:hypothetical protein